MKTWVKLYTEMLNDPKMAGLSLAESGLWCLLIALAGQVDDRDADDQATGLLGSRVDVAWCLRRNLDELNPMLDHLVQCGLLTNHDDRVTVTNYAKRQCIPESSKHDSVSERQRQWYAKHKPNATLTPLCSDPNATLTEPEQIREEQNREEKREGEGAQNTPARAQTQPEPLKPDERPSAIVAFFDEFAFIPAPKGTLWREICANVTDVDQWRAAIHAWHLCGNSTRNVAGMLDWYRTGRRDNRVNGVIPKRGRPSGAPDPDMQRAIEQTRQRVEAEEVET